MSDKKLAFKVIILGPPGCGKGTQCDLLEQKYGILHLSASDILREELVKTHPEIQEKMDKGELVPDELIIEAVIQRLSRDDCKNSWVLEGFPRTGKQASFLVNSPLLPQLDAVIVLDVATETIVERIVGRRLDPETGKIYHLKFSPPPNDPAILKRLVQRSDDTREKAYGRMKKYEEFISDILGKVSSAPNPPPIIRLNGVGHPKEVFQRLSESILNAQNGAHYKDRHSKKDIRSRPGLRARL